MTHERDLERDSARRADRAADDLLPPGRASASAALQGPEHPTPSGIVFRKASGDGLGPDPGSALAAASSSSGSPLPDMLRSQFEGSLGADLSSVRVHTGAESQTAASAVGARAYAVGDDIHFGAGQYDPGSSDGRFLIAHEVAHTVQQRGGAATRQNKLQVSDGGDAHELEADAAASAMVRGAPAAVTSVRGGIVHRKAFGGFAGTAEGRADATSAAAAPGLSPIKISTEYPTKRAQAFSDKMSAFEKGNIPGYHDDKDNTEHALYKILVEIRTGYLADPPRIQQAENVYNQFVEPAAIAEKMMVKFRAMQKQLGFTDDDSPGDSLSDAQKKALGKTLDKDKLSRLKSKVNAKQKLATGTRQEMLGSMQAGLAAAQARVAELETEKKQAADDKKAAIDEKIKAAKEAVEAIVKVVEIAGAVVTAGASAPTALGTRTLSGGDMAKELGKQSTGLIGMTVEAAMSRYYKDEIQSLKAKSRDAAQAVNAAKGVDTEFRGQAEVLRADGQALQLSGHIEEWVNADKDLHDYYVEVSEAAEKASGGKPGGAITQVMALAASASEAKPHLTSAKTMATTASSNIDGQTSSMTAHRYKSYGEIGDAWYGPTKYDGEGPDLQVMKACSAKCKEWVKQADKDEMLLNRAENAVT